MSLDAENAMRAVEESPAKTQEMVQGLRQATAVQELQVKVKVTSDPKFKLEIAPTHGPVALLEINGGIVGAFGDPKTAGLCAQAFGLSDALFRLVNACRVNGMAGGALRDATKQLERWNHTLTSDVKVPEPRRILLPGE